MQPKLTGEVVLTFLNGGISSKSSKPYLRCSNGRSEIFINIPKDIQSSITESTFESYEEDDLITLEVSSLVGSDTVTLVRIVE